MDSLLVNAIKYASSDKNSPRENFITEVFAWLIRNDAPFAQGLLDLIIEKFPQDRTLPFHPTIEMDVDTQLNFNGVFPDMSWKSVSGDWQILFEHKVWSELHTNQLQNYRDYADNFCPPYFMVLITPDRAQHRQNPDVALLWSDISHCIERLEPSVEMQRHREEFLALLEHVGMGFILDGDDIEMKNELENGPVAALILNTNKSLHGHLNQDGHYQTLVAELSKKLTKQSLWTVYDGTKKASYNRWHPLVVYCNLNTLFEGNHDVESQYQRFLTRMQTLLEQLLSCPSFPLFVHAMQAQTIQQFSPQDTTNKQDTTNEQDNENQN